MRHPSQEQASELLGALKLNLGQFMPKKSDDWEVFCDLLEGIIKGHSDLSYTQYGEMSQYYDIILSFKTPCQDEFVSMDPEYRWDKNQHEVEWNIFFSIDLETGATYGIINYSIHPDDIFNEWCGALRVNSRYTRYNEPMIPQSLVNHISWVVERDFVPAVKKAYQLFRRSTRNEQ